MAYYSLNSYKLKLTPLEVFEALKNEKNCFFLDSSLNSDSSLGRYSFLGIDPFYILEAKNQDPFRELKELLNRYRFPPIKAPFVFPGGAVGYLSYDLGFIFEKKLKKKISDDVKIPDCFFGFYNTVVTIDNKEKKLHLFSCGFPEGNSRSGKALCLENLKKIKRLLRGARPPKAKEWRNSRKERRGEIRSNFSRAEYLLAIKKAKRYIKEGDIYQVNLSQRFQAETGLESFEIYRRLRRLSPSYFSAYLDCGDFQIISSSPERFLKLEADLVSTRPMKGTRPRSENREKDVLLKRELLSSEKDKAELTMIVDLERNDLGKVCSYDSVKVAALRRLEKYKTVYQTTSTIQGRLYKDKDGIDLLRACFPGGSITGCPKIRAMEIIEELEPSRRSVYTGALGYLGFSRGMDFNILIRSILKKKNKLYFGAGGGIVADSHPGQEYAETLVKAKAMIEAIR